jgi:hypothetical protein
MSIKRFHLIKNRDYDEFSAHALELYSHILEYSFLTYNSSNPLNLIKNTTMLDDLITHFESLEEFEKCLVLIKVKRCLSGI